jgi:type II secretory pathway pseudopilin PulG
LESQTKRTSSAKNLGRIRAPAFLSSLLSRRPVNSSLLNPKSSLGHVRASGVVGMTMIELAIVMGIVSILMALVLGLARHVDASVKIRHAQADLGEWHETLNRWYLQFGEYPHAHIDTTRDDSVDLFDSIDWELTLPRDHPLTILTNRCETIMPLPNGTTTNITFRSFLTTAISTVDPWGMPYIYLPSDNAQAYTLFSCGPDRKSADIPTGAASTPDPTLDDIYFER